MLLYNGHLFPEADFALPLPNRGLYFNDGFFETMVWSDDGIRYLPQHWQRLQRAAAALGFELPTELASAQALSATLRLLVQVQTGPQRLRLQLWRSGGGLYAPTSSIPDWLATAQSFVAQEAPVPRAGFASSVRTVLSPVSFCKGPQALTYVLAARERTERKLDEALLLSASGHVSEAVAAGVAWIKNGVVHSPAEAAGCVAGTRLAHLRQVANHLSVEWREGLFTPSELLDAEAVFTANVAGIREVRQVETVVFAAEAHPVLARLRTAEVAFL